MKNFVRLFVLLGFCWNSTFVFGQRSIGAIKLTSQIALDGDLSDSAWSNIPFQSDFIINYPTPGVTSTFKTEVKFAYDQQAIYIAANLEDRNPDSVLAILSQRDDFGNADWFAILIDPYGTGQNGFTFAVTAAGVELDAIISQVNQDYSWNAVWKSKVMRTVKGWSLEMRIPLSQLRFPDQDIQEWHINFKRQIRRVREMSYWNSVNPQEYGEIAQSGKVEGLNNLRSPLRLFFSPYSTAYADNFYNNQTKSQEWGFRQRFGMDMKYGLSESFTLDATLVPDFGQTASDNLVLNLSPFEIRYNENRPFFLEGMDLFGIGDLFYTRRIGAQPYNSDSARDSISNIKGKLVEASSQAQLVNATKISGRTKKGMGIGVFNAIEKRSNFAYEDSLGNRQEIEAHPLTNYNVFVLSQNMARNGSLSFINSNVFRPDLNEIANVSGIESLSFTKNKKYSYFVSGRMSALQGGGATKTGHSFYQKFEKVQGSKTFYIDYYETSRTFDVNDLGFMPVTNFRGFTLQRRWVGFQPKGVYLRRHAAISTNLEYLHSPNKYSYWQIDGRVIGTFRNFLTSGIEFSASPIGTVDHFESRRFGNPVNFPASFQIGGFYSSDYSKRYALDFNLYQRTFLKEGMYNFDGYMGHRIRWSNKIFSVFGSSVNRAAGNYGYVYVEDTNYTSDIMIGNRNRWTVNNNISFDYTFTNRMGLVLRLNHYWQEVNYQYFSKLLSDGSTERSAYTGYNPTGKTFMHNISYNAFTFDMVFRWVVYPGSEIRCVWKYNIYASKSGLDNSYFNTFKDLFDQPQLNSFSIKALFFLDAGRLKR